MRRIACIVSALFAAILALSGGATAAPHKKKAAPVGAAPMQVHVVRSAHPGCEPECPQWIAAQGRIVPGTARKFQKVLRGLGDRKLPIFIDSIGGSIVDAYAIGRLIRAKGLTVAVTATTFSPCAPRELACRKAKTGGELRGLAQPYMSKCASACVFILAGGTRRLVGEGTAVGVHQGIKIQRMYWVKKRRASDGSIKTSKTLAWEGKSPVDRKANANMRKYLAEMGMSDMLMSLIEATPHESIRRLAAWELEATRLATEYLNGARLLAGAPAPPFPPRPELLPIKPPAFFGPQGTSGEPSILEVCFKLGRCDQFGWPKDVPTSSGTFPTLIPDQGKGGKAK
ncbi:MAG: hypothetical protein WAN86_24415 [Hyphomicrobiaceae bacterium]